MKINVYYAPSYPFKDESDESDLYLARFDL